MSNGAVKWCSITHCQIGAAPPNVKRSGAHPGALANHVETTNRLFCKKADQTLDNNKTAI
jgi:hypothetical protein